MWPYQILKYMNTWTDLYIEQYTETFKKKKGWSESSDKISQLLATRKVATWNVTRFIIQKPYHLLHLCELVMKNHVLTGYQTLHVWLLNFKVWRDAWCKRKFSQLVNTIWNVWGQARRIFIKLTTDFKLTVFCSWAYHFDKSSALDTGTAATENATQLKLYIAILESKLFLKSSGKNFNSYMTMCSDKVKSQYFLFQDDGSIWLIPVRAEFS